MEAFFSADFSDVRIHTDADSALAVGASAYTFGSHVAFAPGQYAPRSAKGRRLLVHELTHVLQQRGAGAGLQARPAVEAFDVTKPEDPAEREAERVSRATDGTRAPRIVVDISPRVAREQSPLKTKATWTETIQEAINKTPRDDAWKNRLRQIFEALNATEAKAIHDRLTGAPGSESYGPFKVSFANAASKAVWKELIAVLAARFGGAEPEHALGSNTPPKRAGRPQFATYDEALDDMLKTRPYGEGDKQWKKELREFFEGMGAAPAKKLWPRLTHKPKPRELPPKYADPLGQRFWDDVPYDLHVDLIAILSVRKDAPVKITTKPLTEPTPLGDKTKGMGLVEPEAGASLRVEPEDSAKQVANVALNTRLYLDRTWTDRGTIATWYYVFTPTGVSGWIRSEDIRTDLPDPGARLHHIKSGEIGEKIVETYFDRGFYWGKDKRFYVNVLVHVNRGPERPGIYVKNPKPGVIYDFKNTHTRAGKVIWIPSMAFADSLVGKVSSGSMSYEAWKSIKAAGLMVGEFLVGSAAFAAGVIHGALESLYDLLKGLWDLAGLIWDIEVSFWTGQILNDAENLWNSFQKIDWDKLVSGWINDFIDKWTSESLLERWHFRGWVIGYLLMEVLMAAFSGGGATAAKWVGKGAKASKFIRGLAKVAKIEEAVEKIQDINKLRKLVKKAEAADKAAEVGKAADKATDVGKAVDKAEDASKAKAAGAVLAGPTDDLAKAAKLIKPEKGFFDVVVHGTSDAFHVLHDGKWVKLSHRDLATYMKKMGYKKGTPVRLISCSSGAKPTGVAQNLANKLGAQVKAPDATAWIHPNGKITIGPSAADTTGKWRNFEPGIDKPSPAKAASKADDVAGDGKDAVSAGKKDFEGPLRGETHKLPGVGSKRFKYTKRARDAYEQLRNKFNSSVRKNFCKWLAEDADKVKALRKAGLKDADIADLAAGTVPDGFQVHHKIPIDDGGDNAFTNLLLIENEPYHKVITNAQNAAKKGLAVGASRMVELPVPKGFVYPP